MSCSQNSANYQYIVEKAPYATAGSRAFPKNVGANDVHYGARLDWGEKYQKADGNWYRRLYLQPNKDAADSTLKELAQESSHMNLASFAIRADGVDHGEKGFQEVLSSAVNAVHDELGL